MPNKLKFCSYLDADGDFFVWMHDNEGYRWYPKGNWPNGEKGVEAFVDHIARKSLVNPIDITRLRKLAEISLLGRAFASTGLGQDEVFASLAELGQG